jgi:hypothetical protein
MRVQIEPPHQKQTNIPKCNRCQAYFHTKGYCAHGQRCVKCGKSHGTEQCILPKTQPATFLHCGELHPASYWGCKIYQEIIGTRFASSRPVASIYITNTQRQDKEIPSTRQKTEENTSSSDQKHYWNNKTSQQTTHTNTLIKLMHNIDYSLWKATKN